MRRTLLASWVSLRFSRCRKATKTFGERLRTTALTESATDVISIEKSGEHFRLLYDIKGRFAIHRITAEEASYKLLKVKKVQLGAKGVPFIVTHDGRTIRYPDPAIKVNDTVKFDLVENKCVFLAALPSSSVLTFSLPQDRRFHQV